MCEDQKLADQQSNQVELSLLYKIQGKLKNMCMRHPSQRVGKQTGLNLVSELYTFSCNGSSKSNS
jgi:hypothetical protein